MLDAKETFASGPFPFLWADKRKQYVSIAPLPNLACIPGVSLSRSPEIRVRTGSSPD